MVDIIGSHHLYILPPTPSTPEPSETEGRQMKWMHHLINGKKITKACYLNSRFSLPRNAQSKFPTRKWWQILNPEDDDLPKKRMKCHANGLMSQCKCLRSISASYSKGILHAFCLKFKTPSIIVRNINASFKTPAIF